MQEFNHFDFELNGIIRAFFYALRLMISWIASTIFGVHYPLRNIRICQTVLRRRLLLSGRLTEKSRAASADGAYDTRLCHDELRRKKISALIPPRKGAGYWPGEYADRNRAVANQRMTGSNARWKWTTDYNRRSIAETAMYRVKQLFGGSLTLRDYDGQVAEAMALVRALNKMTKAGMPESVRIA